MSEASSLYRRHRPATFDQVVGQRHIVRTLRNAIEQDKVNHAYLFVGSRGTGKTSMAKILAASLNCERGGPTVDPCGVCESCRTIAAGTSVDVIEMDAASNRSVEDVRELRERVAYAPAGGGWKVYILDEAHMLTNEAWNAFLKTLEEPPPNTVFILATTESHKVMATIADRCQRFDFQRPSLEQIVEVVERVAGAEGIEVERPAVAMIARSASGSFRDALGTLDQLVAFGGNRIGLEDVLELLGAADADLMFDCVDAIAAADPKAVLAAVEGMARTGRDPARFARDMLGHLRLLLVAQTTGEVPEAFSVTAADTERLSGQAAAIGPATLVRSIDELAAALTHVREGDEARLAVEIALLKAARPDLDPGSEGLLRRIERLEQSVGGAISPGPGPASAGGGAGAVATDIEKTPMAEAPLPPGPAQRERPTQQESTPAGDDPADAPEPSPPVPEPESESAAKLATPDPTSATSEPAPVAAQPTPIASEPAPVVAEPTPVASEPTSVAAKQPPIDLESLARMWPAVVEQLQSGSAGPVASYFEGARPIAIDTEAGTLEIGFPPDAAFNKRNAEKSERRQQLVEAIDTVCGTRLRPVYKLMESGEDTGSPGGPAPGPADGENEEQFLNRIKSEFNAEEVI